MRKLLEMSPEANNDREGKGEELLYESIKLALHREKHVDRFVARLREWIDEVNHEASYFRRPAVLKPRSAESYALVQKAIGSTRRLREDVSDLDQSTACRTVHDIEPVRRVADDLECFAEFLQELAEKVRPRVNSGTNSRLSLERFTLRGLMWLWKLYFPSVPISYASESKFYRSADSVLQLIGSKRMDIRRLIKQEKAIFAKILELIPLPNRADILDDGTKIVIPIWQEGWHS